MEENFDVNPLHLLANVVVRVIAGELSINLDCGCQPKKRRKLMSEEFEESINLCYQFDVPKRKYSRRGIRANFEHCNMLQNQIRELYSEKMPFEDEQENENNNLERPNLNLRQQERDMPEVLKNYITRLGGSKFLLVMTKTLFSSDVSDRHCRLLISKKKIKEEFLTKEEENTVKMGGLHVPFIDPFLRDKSIVLKEWNMNCKVYALVSGWKDVQKTNDLQKNDVVQLWSFRKNSKLCFALIKID